MFEGLHTWRQGAALSIRLRRWFPSPEPGSLVTSEIAFGAQPGTDDSATDRLEAVSTVPATRVCGRAFERARCESSPRREGHRRNRVRCSGRTRFGMGSPKRVAPDLSVAWWPILQGSGYHDSSDSPKLPPTVPVRARYSTRSGAWVRSTSLEADWSFRGARTRVVIGRGSPPHPWGLVRSGGADPATGTPELAFSPC